MKHFDSFQTYRGLCIGLLVLNLSTISMYLRELVEDVVNFGFAERFLEKILIVVLYTIFAIVLSLGIFEENIKLLKCYVAYLILHLGSFTSDLIFYIVKQESYDYLFYSAFVIVHIVGIMWIVIGLIRAIESDRKLTDFIDTISQRTEKVYIEKYGVP
ncbi:uncharacterized protein LOC129740920 [Uranotaenia lowii]|uniref:uncharacterized protein LOC129740920 n=1 Tax=Uranotaenia lowii TaxID=190385 RepID=UPI002479C830|nr:uncharacterized protein LOC129740920 [Uranotaenia lowii]